MRQVSKYFLQSKQTESLARKKCLNNKSKHLSLFRCEPGYFGFPNCQNCSCAEPGSSSNVCDELSGKVKNNETHFKSYPYFRKSFNYDKQICV